MHKTNAISLGTVNRILAGLLVLLLVVLALVGCSDDKPQGDKPGSQPGETNLPAQGGYNVDWQSYQKVDNLKLLVDEKSGDYVVQVPGFVDTGDSAGLQILNGELQDEAEDCLEWLRERPDGKAYLHVEPYIIETDNTLSIVLFKEEIPCYGTDGEVESFVYDKMTGYPMDDDLALAQSSTTDDDIAQALENYIAEQMNDGVKHKWREFSDDAFYVDTDGKVVIIVEAEISTEGADDWEYLLLYKDGEIIGKFLDTIQ